jgi:Na+/H+ antiporter NhaC
LGDYGILSLIPPLLAIILCFITKEVLSSLLIGIIVGATIVSGWNPIAGAMKTTGYMIANCADEWNATMILFSFIMGGFVGLIKYSGGARGFADFITQKVKNPLGVQVSAWILGLIFFFEDISNTAIVGNTFRPLTDKLKVSREKLAYIVDSTSAPVCSLSIISTWIAYQVGLIGAELQGTQITTNPYTLFVQSIPYSFYSIYALIFVFIIAISGRDFGPMLQAEYRARTTGKVLADTAKPITGEIEESITSKPWAINMIIPIITLIAVALVGMWWTGGGPSAESVTQAINDSDSMTALFWAGAAGVIVCMVMYSLQKIGTFEELMNALIEGIKMMVIANIILLLAWALGSVTEEIGTANFIITNVQSIITPSMLPLIVFIASCIISYMIGTSWGTMAIVTPIAIPLALTLNVPVFIAISGVLSGSVMGDHCSPISDTTVLSSMFSGCDHMDHVRTQMPYSLLVTVMAIISYILVAIGFPVVMVLVLGIVMLYGALYYISNITAAKMNIKTPLKQTI